MRFPEVSLARADFTELCDLLEVSGDEFEHGTTGKKFRYGWFARHTVVLNAGGKKWSLLFLYN